jgi:alanine dehydrogenase
MLVGSPTETKDNEYRVGLVPSTVRELTSKGHQVIIETEAGIGAGLPNADYEAAGAEIVANADAVFSRAEMIVKVKEPHRPSARSFAAGRSCLPISTLRQIAHRPRI